MGAKGKCMEDLCGVSATMLVDRCIHQCMIAFSDLDEFLSAESWSMEVLDHEAMVCCAVTYHNQPSITNSHNKQYNPHLTISS